MASYVDGTLVRATGPEIALMAGGVRRWVPDPPTFDHMGLDWGKVVAISDAEWSTIPSGPPFPSRADGTLLKGSGPQIYVMQGGQRRWIPDPATFDASGYQWSAVRQIADGDLAAIPEALAEKPIAHAKPATVEETIPQTLASVAPAITTFNESSAELTAMLERFTSEGPLSTMDLIELQDALLKNSLMAAMMSAIAKEHLDTLRALLAKIG